MTDVATKAASKTMTLLSIPPDRKTRILPTKNWAQHPCVRSKHDYYTLHTFSIVTRMAQVLARVAIPPRPQLRNGTWVKGIMLN